jgi:uncharacterized membrane protein YkvA (DUF1232 family)
MEKDKVGFSLKDIYKRFKASRTKASELFNDKEKAKNTIDKAFRKANSNKGDLEGIWSQLQTLMSLARDYYNGVYREIPGNSVIAILAGLLYFLSPVDLVPDFILALGFMDDVFIIGLVVKQVSKDLEKYRQWKKAGSGEAPAFPTEA